MPRPFRILLVDDDANLLESLGDVLEQNGYQVAKASSAEEALKVLHGDQFHDLVVLDVVLPQMSGLDLLKRIHADLERPPAVIMMTGFGRVESAVQAMKSGAVDYLEKPVNPDELLLTIKREHERQQLVDQNIYFMRELSERYRIENIVGLSPAMREVFDKVRCVAASDAPVMILGECGTGKELIANHIHYSSARQKGPLIKVACAALASGVLESELFGHERGAFTGATHAKPGRFELADGGTLFLDEVGDIPIAFQAKLLRVLQSMEFERVGGTRLLKSDFRIISATNHDLSADIEKGLFRSDLYYRLNTVVIEMPPLRQRREDIPLLLNHFIQIYSSKMNKLIKGSTADLLPILEGYPWPGNVRELKNMVERAFVYCQDDVIGIRHLPPHICHPEPRSLDLSHLPIRSLAEVERGMIELCLREAGGNKTKTAEMLGITRSTLLSKMDKYDLSIPGEESANGN